MKRASRQTRRAALDLLKAYENFLRTAHEDGANFCVTERATRAGMESIDALKAPLCALGLEVDEDEQADLRAITQEWVR